MPPMALFSNPSEDLTTMWCDTRRLTKLHFPRQHQRLNNTATSPSTTIKFLLKRESRRMKTSTTMANRDPRVNRTNPKYHELLGVLGTRSTLCVLDVVCCCPVCFLSVWCYMVLVLVFHLLALKTLRCVKLRLGSLFRMCFPSHRFMSAWVA
jgi:hypothetical protein